MARIKGATMTRKRRNKVLKLAKGYYGSKSKLVRVARQAVMKSGNYAYTSRRLKIEERNNAIAFMSIRQIDKRNQKSHAPKSNKSPKQHCGKKKEPLFYHTYYSD